MNILLIFTGFIVAFIIVLYYKYRIKRLIEIKLVCKESNKNNVHFYVARDMNDDLWLYIGKPFRGNSIFCSSVGDRYFAILSHDFNSFGLNEKDYDNLRWEDEPVEVFINLKD